MKKIKLIIFGVIALCIMMVPIRANDAQEEIDFSINTSKNIIDTNETFTVEINPLNIVKKDDPFININFLFMGERLQECVQVEYVELPKAYVVGDDGKKYGVSYGLYDIEYAEKTATDFIFALDNPSQYITIDRDALLAQANGKKPTLHYLIMIVVNEDGTYNTDVKIEEFHMEGPIRIHYKINDCGNAYNKLGYAYMLNHLETQTASGVKKVFKRYKLIYFNSTHLVNQDLNAYIESDLEYDGKLIFKNECIYNNTQMIARIQSNDIEIISPDFKLTDEEHGVYQKILLNESGKYLNLEPGASWETEFKYKLKNSNLKEGDVAEYTVDYYVNGDNQPLHTQTHKMVLSKAYNVEYVSNLFQESLPIDNLTYHINDHVMLQSMEIDSDDYEFN